MQSERKVEEVNFSLKLAAIEIEKALRESKDYIGDSVAENLEGNKRRFKEALSLTQEAFTVENMTKISVNRVLNQLKEKLAERKLEVETLKSAQIIRIPAQFLASVKLAENKKKYSPTKSSRIIKKNQRSISANR